jgi:hypothetical protein
LYPPGRRLAVGAGTGLAGRGRRAGGWPLAPAGSRPWAGRRAGGPAGWRAGGRRADLYAGTAPYSSR